MALAHSRPNSSEQRTSLSPERVLGSNESAICSQLVELIKISDIRFDIGIMGVCWDAIPARLGSSAALDTATLAFIHGQYNVHRGMISRESIVAYGTAMRALRVALSDPAQLYNGNTMCAIYLIYLSQVRQAHRKVLILSAISA